MLSILICTIPEREVKFKALMHELDEQVRRVGNVQIIYDDRQRSEVSVGQKRNDLLNKAIGDYVCFIDDDDSVPSYYIEEIINAAKLHPDCIGFNIYCDMEGKICTASASNKYEWEENKDGFRYVRSIYHKTPVLRDHALKIGFADMRFGEDYDYSKRLRDSGLLKNEIYIDRIMYFYNYKYQNPKEKYGLP